MIGLVYNKFTEYNIMKISNVLQQSQATLPQSLRNAQEAMEFPEVQDMLRKLSEYNLGIYMPHKHSEASGEFELLPDDVSQVESGLEVSFRPLKEITNQPDRFLPVAWLWRSGRLAASAACEMVRDEKPEEPEPKIKHKMPKRDK